MALRINWFGALALALCAISALVSVLFFYEVARMVGKALGL